MDKRVKAVRVMITELEMAELRRRAGREPLSSYCRRVLCGEERETELIQVNPRVKKELGSITDSSCPNFPTEVESAPATKRRGKLCAHGKLANVDNCWRCGGRARGEG
jgi:hypothetical protein